MKNLDEIKTGGVKMVQIDGKYNVWTKKVGGSAIKMLALHEGSEKSWKALKVLRLLEPKSRRLPRNL